MYMRQNIVSHFMSLCRFGHKIGLKLGAKTGRSDTFYPKQHYVTLDYDRNATAMSFWISITGAIAKIVSMAAFCTKRYEAFWSFIE